MKKGQQCEFGADYPDDPNGINQCKEDATTMIGGRCFCAIHGDRKPKVQAKSPSSSGSEVLHLTLHRKWFDMIASGEKREEYRQIKPYWNRRLNNRKYDAIRFVNGYGASRPWMLVELKESLMGLGIVEWGAPESQLVHILRLGHILESNDQR